MKVEVLGVKVDDVSLKESVDIVCQWLDSANKGKKYFIATPNPEFIVVARGDKKFLEILNTADLAIPDGVGLKLSGKVKNTTPGVDLMNELVNKACEKGFTVGFLGGKNGVAKETSERLIKKYPGLKVIFAEDGGDVDSEGNILRQNNIPRLDILFVAFGQGKQEKWISKNLDKLPVRVAMGVGGAFDYLSGRVMRAPGWVRQLGLEWLFRLIVQPWRIKRQIVLLKFLWMILTKNNLFLFVKT